ncbi:MAG TPA: hypothetical protein VGI40_26835 [Pirellulaceae bacterium]
MALAFSFAVAIVSMLMLDFGESARATGGGLLVFWACALVAILRKPERPARFDLLLIRWGCLPLVIGFNVMMQVIWHWRT